MAIRSNVLVCERSSAIAICVGPNYCHGPRRVVRGNERNGIAFLHRDDRVKAPSAYENIQRRVHISSKVSAAAHRYLPHRADDKRLRNIRGSRAIVACEEAAPTLVESTPALLRCGKRL